ncbi:GNAT family N-acetyltransferase [Latilactobacillus curvatus]|uniref:GNAT family N-acetyltransferase n=1 Tax=Latilactobacillus curvatus TaxID=28038 RepID=UPI000FEC9FBC|nr:GNAT family N-acetyltransferase [Latilactobacillus curvatus]MDT3393903.1 GNAT family N-acetyltransferase [Bacillota bacterium]QAR35443.1 GNAT family N-acetyltransferase [Latilactobacillus curvatus]
MEIRRYQQADCQAVAELFYKTVHTVNASDYTKAQLAVWATGEPDLKQWDQSLQSHFSVVALENDTLIGFGDIDQTGYLDRLFTHADYQRRGVATAICHQLEQAVAGRIVTHASITARPFFESRGYQVVREQQVARQGVLLTNFVMEKDG